MITPGMYVKTRKLSNINNIDYICWRNYDTSAKESLLTGNDVYMQFGLVIAVIPNALLYANSPMYRKDVVMLLSSKMQLGFSVADRWESL